MESFEIFIVILHTCFSMLGISVNLALLIVMIRHTPTSFSNFGILLKVHVLADLTNSLGCVAEMPRMIVIERSILFISYGPCGYVSTSACYCASVAMFGGEVCSFYIILASFVFRLLVIEGKNPSKRTTYGIICGIALPIPTAMMIALFLARTSDADAQQLMNAFDTEYGAYTHVVTGAQHVKTICYRFFAGQKDAHSLATMAEFFIMILSVP
ncbi:hypothetical protein PRIPAC_83027, partial [Pristionchus pacificus]|uniref:G protein-coupled receptor n=1 Tax=Pristionchus pacificus TaxID=54126 RepID=A0A2A6CML1_PRIPA